MVFDRKELKDYYLEYDVTNPQEAAGMIIVIILNLILLTRLLFNFRAIIRWYLQNEEVDPKKLLCINSVLLISVILRLISENYSLWGCIFSGFFYFKDDNYVAHKTYIYNNIVVYSVLEQFYIQFQNLAMLIASKFWLYVIQAKYLYEANFAPKQDINNSTERPRSLLASSISQNSPFLSLNTSLQLLKVCSFALRAGWIIIVLVTISSCLMSTYKMFDQATNTMISSLIIISSTILSGVIFSFSCLIIYFDLEAFYTVDPKYKQRVIILTLKKEQMRKAALFLVITQIVRFSFNSLRIFASESLITVKSGGQDKFNFPDQGYYWALIVPCYSFVVDFIPTFFLSELFSPLPAASVNVYPEGPDDGWDVKSIS